MASGGSKLSLLQAVFVKKVGKFYYDLLTLVLKFNWLTLKKLHSSGGSRKLPSDIFSPEGKQNLPVSEVFREYLTKFSIFFHGQFFVCKNVSLSCSKHKKFDYDYSSYHGNEAQNPNFDYFLRILEFFALFVSVKALLTYENDF